MRIALYPIVDDPDSLPRDGVLQRTPTYCRKANRATCAAYYRSIAGKTGPHTCPHGYGTQVIELGDGLVTFSGLNLTGHSDKKKIKARKPEPNFPKVTCEELVQAEITFANTIGTFHQALANHYDNYLKATLHEVRKLNGQIKEQVEESLDLHKSGSGSWEFLQYRLKNILGSSSLMSVRLNSFDFLANPASISTQRQPRIPVFRRFEKAFHVLDSTAQQKNLRIDFAGSSFSQISGYEIFDILPYVLLENAIKYSPRDHRIDVVFDDRPDYFVVKISSFGPHVEPSEIETICSPNGRGRNAKRTCGGSGTGLYLARQICNFHRVEIRAFTTPEPETIVNQVPYGLFELRLTLHDATGYEFVK